MEYSFMSLEKNESSLSSSFDGESYSAILPGRCYLYVSTIPIRRRVSTVSKNIVLTVTENQDKIAVDDCMNPVSDRDHGSVLEFPADDLLYHPIGRGIDRGCRLI